MTITKEKIVYNGQIIGTYKNENGDISVSIHNGAIITLVRAENYYLRVDFSRKAPAYYGPGLCINNKYIADNSDNYLCSFEGDKNAALAAFICASAKIHTSGKYHDFCA